MCYQEKMRLKLEDKLSINVVSSEKFNKRNKNETSEDGAKLGISKKGGTHNFVER